MTSGIVFNIMKYSISDGPGIRSTVFLKGCPLTCWWCHNPESQSSQVEPLYRQDRCTGCGACINACGAGALTPEGFQRERCVFCGDCFEACASEAWQGAGKVMTVGQVMAEIEKDILFYDESGGGVTFSGGEPLMQPEFLRQLLKECRRKEIPTAVDTSGYGPWPYLQEIAAHVGIFLYDLKIMNDEKHRHYTGVSNRLILDNLQKLCRVHNHVLVRFPVIPGFTDEPDNIESLGRFISPLNIKGIELLPYHKIGIEKYARLHVPYALQDLEPPGEEIMERLQNRLRGFHINII